MQLSSMDFSTADKKYGIGKAYPIFLVRRKGLEPLTYWFVASHSIQLSYQRVTHFRNVLRYDSTNILKMQALFSKNQKLFFAGKKGRILDKRKCGKYN